MECMNHGNTHASDAVKCQNCAIVTDWLTLYMYCNSTKYITCDYGLRHQMSLYQLSIENLFTNSFLWRSRYIWFEILPLKIGIWRKWWLEIWDLAKWFKPVLERFVRVCVCQMMIVMLGVQWKFSWKRFSAACPTVSAENSSTKSVVVRHLSHTNSACSCFVLHTRVFCLPSQSA